MLYALVFLSPVSSTEGLAKLGDLLDGYGMHGAQGVQRERKEGEPFSLAELTIQPPLVFVGHVKSMTWLLCSLLDEVQTKSVYDGYVEASIFSRRPTTQKQIRGSGPGIWYQSSLLAKGGEICRGFCVIQEVTKKVMPRNPLSLIPAAD